MLEAVGEVFPETKYQRCTVYFYRVFYDALRMYRSCHHDLPYARKQAGSLQGYAGHTVYELQCPADHLHLVLRDVFPG